MMIMVLGGVNGKKKQNQKLKTKLTGLATTENYELPKNKNKYFKLQSWLI